MSQPRIVASDSDTLIHFGDALKSLDDSGKVGGYLVRFSDSAHKDLDGEFFTAKTYYGARQGDGADCMFHHGLPIKGISSELSDHLFAPIKTKVDEVGVFAETILNLSDDFEAEVKGLVDKERLSWSSGAPVHMVRKTTDGEIKRWPIAEGSFTHRPAEPSNRIVSLKTFHGLFVPSTTLAVKGLLKEKLAERTPSWWETEQALRDVLKDIANAVRSSRITGVTVDVKAQVTAALTEFVDELSPSLVTQIEDWASDPTEDYFYIKSLKSGRRNSARDQQLIDQILTAAKELGAAEEKEPGETTSQTKKPVPVTDTSIKAFLDLAELELSTLN
jgi:hypothetical protein